MAFAFPETARGARASRSRPAGRLLACLCCAALAAASGCVADPSDHLDRARELAFQRQPAAALAEYEEVLSLLAKKDGKRFQHLMVPALKGAADLCHLELGQTKKAVEYYRQIANHFPDAREALEARANLSTIYRGLGDRRLAVAELTAIVQGFPDDPDADRYQYQAAKDYFELGDFDQVALEVKVLFERFPQSKYCPDAQMLLGAALYLQGQKERAVDAYTRVSPTSKLRSAACFEAAQILSELGEDQRAVDLLVEALKTHPDPKSIQEEIARIRKRLAARRLPQRIEKGTIWPEWYGGIPD